MGKQDLLLQLCDLIRPGCGKMPKREGQPQPIVFGLAQLPEGKQLHLAYIGVSGKERVEPCDIPFIIV